MTDVEFAYRLCGAGWSAGRLRVGSDSVDLTASYLDDALGDLVRGALALARGASQVRFAWAEEPGEFRWVLIREGSSLVVRILLFEDGPWSRKADEDGDELFAASCDPQAFATAVAKGAVAVRDELGPDGYKQRWMHDFPSGPLEELLALTTATG